MIAVDSSVLIDLLGDDARADAAEDACAQAPVRPGGGVRRGGQVWSSPGWGTAPSCWTRWKTIGIVYRHGMRRPCAPARCSAATARRPRPAQRRTAHRARLPDRRPRPVAVHRLITRDAGFFRDYFKGLKVIVPQA
jgi:hypothetical protein